jgi:hypothetical protein
MIRLISFIGFTLICLGIVLVSVLPFINQKVEYCYIESFRKEDIRLIGFVKNGADRQLYNCSNLTDCLDAAKLLGCEVK